MRSLKDIGLFVVVIFIRYIDYYWLKVGALQLLLFNILLFDINNIDGI